MWNKTEIHTTLKKSQYNIKLVEIQGDLSPSLGSTSDCESTQFALVHIKGAIELQKGNSFACGVSDKHTIVHS